MKGEVVTRVIVFQIIQKFEVLILAVPRAAL